MLLRAGLGLRISLSAMLSAASISCALPPFHLLAPAGTPTHPAEKFSWGASGTQDDDPIAAAARPFSPGAHPLAQGNPPGLLSQTPFSRSQEIASPELVMAAELRHQFQELSAEEIGLEIEKGHYYGEVVPGMTHEDVRSVWGNPHEIFTTGMPELGHEKWVYLDRSTPLLHLGTERAIYFEEHRVIGWELGGNEARVSHY